MCPGHLQKRTTRFIMKQPKMSPRWWGMNASNRSEVQRIVHFLAFSQARNVTSDLRIGALPDWLQSYALRLQQGGLFAEIPDQVIINEYQPGQGIFAHIDCVPCFADTIASLSLGSPCVMDFTHRKTGEKSSLLLEPRSLLVLTGDARYV